MKQKNKNIVFTGFVMLLILSNITGCGGKKEVSFSSQISSDLPDLYFTVNCENDEYLAEQTENILYHSLAGTGIYSKIFIEKQMNLISSQQFNPDSILSYGTKLKIDRFLVINNMRHEKNSAGKVKIPYLFERSYYEITLYSDIYYIKISEKTIEYIHEFSGRASRKVGIRFLPAESVVVEEFPGTVVFMELLKKASENFSWNLIKRLKILESKK